MTVIDAGNPPNKTRLLADQSVDKKWSHPAQKMLALLSLGVVLGSFMPWIETAIGSYGGFAGPGPYLFYAGVIGLGGGMVPVRRLAILQGAALSAVAVSLPIWQLLKLFTKVGFGGWSPGVGLALVLGCGLMATKTTLALSRPKPS